MKENYCVDCKFIKLGYSRRYLFCFVKTEKNKDFISKVGEGQLDGCDPYEVRELNANCKYYKRKWWKFWVAK